MGFLSGGFDFGTGGCPHLCISFRRRASGHDEEMEDLVRTEVLVAGIEDRKLQGVDDAAHGVDDATGQKPAKG